MHKQSRGMIQIGAIGTLAGLLLVPVLNSKTRKKISRSSRNTYFRVADFVQDLKEMATR